MAPRPLTAGRPVFIYGSLMYESVLQVLLGRIPQAKPALLRGYVRRRIKGERFPGLSPMSGAEDGTVVRGLVLDDLTTREAAVFDEFEDDEYDKELIKPMLATGVECDNVFVWGQTPPKPADAQLEGNSVTALAYIWTDLDKLDDINWLPERDFVPYEAEYLEMCKTFLVEDVPEDVRDPPAEMKISKKSVGFYTHLAKLFLTGTAEKQPAKRLQISALGNSIDIAVSVATRLELESMGKIDSVRTGYLEMESRAGTRSRCAHIQLEFLRA